MAHRELAARYAKGLNAATQRVVELETAVADADYKADQASMAASAATCALGPSTASRERSSRATTARIKALEAKLASRPPANNELARQLDEARKSLTEEHRQLIEAQRQLTSSKSFATRLQRERAQLEESQTSIAALTAEREQEVMRLKTELGREKKRRERAEAEVVLGPDGKRCKKCNPMVIDLSEEVDDDDDDFEDAVEGS